MLDEKGHDQDMNLSALAHNPIDLSCRWNNYRDCRNELYPSRDGRPYFLGVVVGNAMRVPAVPAAQPEVIKENVWKSVTLRSKLSYYRTGDWLDRNLPHQ